MVSTLKRQVNEEEKKIILKRFGRICYATGHAIPESEQIQFDHIHAHSQGGDSELNNIAPMCGPHNREKGTLSLADFRVKLQLDAFFSKSDKLTLKDLLIFLKSEKRIADFGQGVVVTRNGDTISVDTKTKKLIHTLYACPTTGWHYFYATLDVSIIDSDDESDDSAGLQPRYLIKDKVFSLFRHFQRHPVLQPSIGRVAGAHIRLFDGQHKVAALLMNNKTIFECKIYLDPDLRLLNQSNIAAHDTFAQTRFYSSIMVLKLGTEFSKDFADFKDIETPVVKSEQAFFDYLLSRPGTTLTRGELNRRFRSHLYSSILGDPNNKLDRFVSRVNRGTDEQPLTFDVLEKSIFSHFLLREPTADCMASASYRRDDEQRNLVELCNMLVEGGLDAWNPKATAEDQDRRRLERLFGSKSMMAWSELLWDAVCARLDLIDSDERLRVFYRPLSSVELNRVRKTVQRLHEWQRWIAPKDDQIDRILSDKKSAVKEWFKAHGLTPGYLMGASA